MTQACKILVAGYPKSGTTMLFSRIKHALPENADVFFEPPEAASVCERLDEARCAAAKILLPAALDNGVFTALNPHFSRKLLIIRDPRDILVSSLLYTGGYEVLWRAPDHEVRACLDLLAAKERDPGGISLLRLFTTIMGSTREAWLGNIASAQKMLMDFIAANPDFFPVRYEELTEGNPPALEEYLGLSLESETTVDSSYQRVARSRKSGSWRDWLTGEDKALLKPVMADFLARFGYDPEDWDTRVPPRIPAEFASGYLLKILNERRRGQHMAEVS